MDTSITAVGVILVGLLQIYTNYRLKLQDNAREAASAEQKEIARAVEKKVEVAQKETTENLQEIHILVNTRLTDAMDRIGELESKLGLSSGEPIPGPATVTRQTKRRDNA